MVHNCHPEAKNKLPLYAFPLGVEERAAVLGRERADDLEHVPDANGYRDRCHWATQIYARKSIGGQQRVSNGALAYVARADARRRRTRLEVPGADRYGGNIWAFRRLLGRPWDVQELNVNTERWFGNRVIVIVGRGAALSRRTSMLSDALAMAYVAHSPWRNGVPMLPTTLEMLTIVFLPPSAFSRRGRKDCATSAGPTRLVLKVAMRLSSSNEKAKSIPPGF